MCVFTNEFVPFLCHVCQADKNILLRQPCRERKVQKKKGKRQTSLLSPPPQPLAAPLRAFLLFFSCRGLANSSRLARAHTHARTRAQRHTQLVSCPSSILRFPPSGCGCRFMHGGSSTSPWLHYERETEVGWIEAAAQKLTMWRVEEARLTEVRMKGAPRSAP